MASFQNTGSVEHQIGTQHVQGSVYHIHEASPRKHLHPDGLSQTDEAILDSLAFPLMLDRRSTTIQPPHRSTCQWILKLGEYKRWTCESRGLLWIKGKPGAGKSTMMAFLHEKLKHQYHTRSVVHLDFFFNARGAELQRTFLGMLRSLQNQLYLQSPKSRTLLREIYLQKQAAYGRTKQQWSWREEELKSIFERSLLLAAQQQQLILFVDALDEAGSQRAWEIAKYLTNINDLAVAATCDAKICISSRHYPVLTTEPGTEIWLEEFNGGDIAKFVDDRIDLRHLMEDSPSEVQAWRSIKRFLTRHADGIFQWVSIVVPLVERALIDGEAASHILVWMQQVPEELDDLYQYVLLNVIERKSLGQSLALFQWITCAARPLELRELRFALVAKDAATAPSLMQCHQTKDFIATDQRMKLRVRTLSGGLVEIKDTRSRSRFEERYIYGKVAQVIHQTVKEFLLAKGLSLLASMKLENTSDLCPIPATAYGSADIISQSHARIFLSCLNYIHTEDIEHHLRNHNYDETPWFNRVLPLARYAADEIFRHAEQCMLLFQPSSNRQMYSLQSILTKLLILHHTNHQDLSEFDQNSIVQGGPGATGLLLRERHLLRPCSTILHLLSMQNVPAITRHIVQHSADIDQKDSRGSTALHTAARYGTSETVQMLVDAGANINAEDENGVTPLVGAVLAQSLSRFTTVEFLLDRGAEIHQSSDTANNAWLIAISQAQPSMISKLIRAGVEINASNSISGTALHVATTLARSETLLLLISEAADVNVRGGPYTYVLQAAIVHGVSTEDISHLIRAGADVNACGGHFGYALQAAAACGRADTVRILLGAGSDINARGGHYSYALTAAAAHGSIETLRILLAAGANFDCQAGKYGYLLHAAAARGSISMVRALLELGADVNAYEGYHGYALHAAAKSGVNAVVRLLLEAGADVNAQGGEYGQALQAAAGEPSDHVFNLLLQWGSDVTIVGGVNGNALTCALLSGYTDRVERLLELGAHIDVYSQAGETPLMIAIKHGWKAGVSLLLDRGANPGQCDDYGRTSLHIGAGCRTSDVVLLRQLLEHCDSPNPVDLSGQTPLHVAIGEHRVDLFNLLLEWNADPLLQDCFGQSALDWSDTLAATRETTAEPISHPCITFRNLDPTRLRESVRMLSEKLLNVPHLEYGYHVLGRCLLFLQDIENATFCFQQYYQQHYEGSKARYSIECDLCEQSIKDTRWTCKICPDSDLCRVCRARSTIPESQICNQHPDSIEIIPTVTSMSTEEDKSRDYEVLLTHRLIWLKNLLQHYKSSTHQTINTKPRVTEETKTETQLPQSSKEDTENSTQPVNSLDLPLSILPKPRSPGLNPWKLEPYTKHLQRTLHQNHNHDTTQPSQLKFPPPPSQNPKRLTETQTEID